MRFLHTPACSRMLRSGLTLLSLAFGISLGLAANDDRSAWRAGDKMSQHYFLSAGGGTWYETDQGRVTFAFREISRTPEAITLLDAPRNIAIRLSASQSELATDGGQTWGPFLEGRWIGAKARPAVQLPPPPDHKIRVIYFVPADRAPTAGYLEKIRTLLTFVADVFRDDLQAKNYDTPGPQFQTQQGQITVHLVRGTHPARYYNGHPRYNENKQDELIRQEVPESVFAPASQVGIFFTEVYEPIPAPFEWAGGIAHGSKGSDDAGSAFFSAWILQDAFCPTTRAGLRRVFSDTTPVPGRTAMGHGQRNSPRFEFVEDGIGAVIHELGHALGLPHDRHPQSIMGNGFRDLRANVLTQSRLPRVGFIPASARMLMCHRHLNPALDRSDALPPTGTAELVGQPELGATQLRLQLTARDDKALRALLVYVENGEGDYVVAGQELTGTQQTLALDLTLEPLKPGPFQVVIHLADQGGNHHTLTLSHDLSK